MANCPECGLGSDTACGCDVIDSHEDPDNDPGCHYCGGEGYGHVGTDWDCDDPINGPYDGEFMACPCCGGSGSADDCTFW